MMIKVPLNLMILTNYFAIEPRNIKGGIGYRYVGLYGSSVKTLLKISPESKVFWYSHLDKSLRIIHLKKMMTYRTSMIKALLYAILTTLREGKYLAVVIAFPYAVPKVSAILWYILSLVILRCFAITRVKIIIDDFDPPVEISYAFSKTRPSTLSVIYGRAIEMLTLKSASLIITVSNSLKQYLAEVYHVRKDKILIIPNGCLVRFIRCIPPKTKGPLVILYSGSIMKTKNIDKLLSVVENVRNKGLDISIVLTGKLVDVSLPEWAVQKQVEDWIYYVKDHLEKSDVCVIPYPSKLFWNLTLLAKLFDYMAAGKPIISTNLKEKGNIIKTFNCGLIAKDWKEFEQHIERLYQDRELAIKLGKNGRKAAERYFDYEKLAKNFLPTLIEMFRESS